MPAQSATLRTAVKRTAGRPSAAESREIRDGIIEAAIDEFVTFGYEKANLNRIAKAAHSTKTTIYRMFESKEALFKEAIRFNLERVEFDFDFEANEHLSPTTVLRKFAASILERYRDGRASALWRAAVSVKNTLPHIHQYTITAMDQLSFASKFASYIEYLNKKKKTDIKYPMMVAHNFAALVGPAQEAQNKRGREYTEDERIEEIVRLFIKGYLRD